ncbi:MAG: helix-turn-helix transcriptional regulator [Lentisphaeria bacterium]|nr:helix-turn-helix transcriptional regulator [Lentisphaeria bacterium]
MKIRFDKALWAKLGKTERPDVASPLAPVTNIRCWVRDESGMSGRGGAAVHKYHCLYLCLEGAGKIEIDAVPYLIGENEAIGVLPQHPHRRPKGETPVKYFLIRFEPVDPGLLLPLFDATLRLGEEVRPFIQELVGAYERVCRNETLRNCNDVGLRLGLLLNALMTCAKREFSAAPSGNQRLSEVVDALLDPENIGLSLKEIAFKLGITSGHLTDCVRDAMGYSPRHIRQVTRYHAAVDCLLHTTLSISKIAEKTGFRSVYAFSRFFHRITGMSPTAFRRKYGKTREE